MIMQQKILSGKKNAFNMKTMKIGIDLMKHFSIIYKYEY